MSSWFIADLHLDSSRPGAMQCLLELLEQIGERADALYILGDLFEYWVGDDALDSPYAAVFLPLVTRLQQLSERGVKLYFQHGNRDFLVGKQFAEATGCTLLPEQQVIDLYGTPTLLLHGDTLCTDDVEYQQVRKLFRNPQWQQQFLALPLEERIRQAEAMRAQSRMSMQGKPEAILDVNQQAVEATLRAAGVTCMIHGHTHRPAVHDFLLDDLRVQRVVLGDWHETKGSFLRVDADTMTLEC
ncbi:UDP-2,3-diacylglucosamine diphosphatase [Thiothrix winogradskyi]|uniref:UDP-2,3-diacylglucosamine hydrolase n=1 Tax=Thiothrix winogradskyi TaxID=96472 RepID=A0ABY3SV54_9GAMM|nr:UDP-2,3-diacylglucosamine diphosphatase [Thiothrix winogradskyi]UJS23014.1 UDP-2,3-diacylglucosamine diphosphatase [Thiothrix winogradskyi]